MLTGDGGIEDFAADGFEGFQRAKLVGTHETAITSDISS
jgi:hypothetical protein